MKNLLIVFLLLIFSFQGATVAIGKEVAVALQLENQQASTVMKFVDVDNDTDGLKVSSTIEELSDYIVFDSSIAQALHSVTAQRMASVPFLSIILPTLKPPPCG
ncbi:hypothetical protein ABC383_25450 [Noviherbaspirillum sp. 1P10PC]|uniref:hypothetical protein n=1 Tax=Noviherbaspirillum sp. 1P10PC TaxID=3132292 RepID=UPI0039A00711